MNIVLALTLALIVIKLICTDHDIQELQTLVKRLKKRK